MLIETGKYRFACALALVKTELVHNGQMKTAATRSGIATPKRTKRAAPAQRRLERLEAGYREVRVRLDRLQKTLDAALADGRLSLATVDADDLESVRRYEARRLQDAGQRLRQEMKSLTNAGVVDAKGRRVRQDVPADMREGSDCDL